MKKEAKDSMVKKEKKNKFPMEKTEKIFSDKISSPEEIEDIADLFEDEEVDVGS